MSNHYSLCGLLLLSLSFMLATVHCRTHYHKNHGILPLESHISFPPSPAPQAADVGSAAAPHSYTVDDPMVFDVRKYGAVGDSVTDDTEAFKEAWDAACGAESATLFVPHGHTFMIQSTIFTGPCRANLVVQVSISVECDGSVGACEERKTHCKYNFQIDGTVVAPDGPDSWPRRNSKRQWLVFYRIHGLLMRGGGAIDGRGEKWWDLPCKPHKVTTRSFLS